MEPSTQFPVRKIIHVDMDAFYASVEQRDHPEYRGKPIIVGGSPKSRGVVCTASYEARVFGVHSAMSCAQAYRQCPQGIFVRPRFEAYKAVSQQIQQIFYAFTDLVEPLSLDEAYLDVTQNKVGEASATRIAQEIRRRIRAETGLTASAGVAPNKFLAKLASEAHKPDGLTVIRPEKIEGFLLDLPVRKIHGIGKATEARMLELGIERVRDLLAFPEATLAQHFGKSGHWYYQLARGQDNRPVRPRIERKSIGSEETFAQDVLDVQWLEQKLWSLCEDVMRDVKTKRFLARTATVKLTYSDFEKITRSKTVDHPLEGTDALWQLARVLLLEHTQVGARKVRLLGVSVSHPQTAAPVEALALEEGPQLLLPFMALPRYTQRRTAPLAARMA